MTFANAGYFFLLLLLIPIIMWYFLGRSKSEPSMQMSTTEQYKHMPRTWRMALIHLPFLLRVLIFILVVIILARPQTHNAFNEKETEGIDIMMAMDISTSMLTPDLRPNRIEASKQVAYEFINNRPNDNIGLTLFGGEAFTQCPLTIDHKALLNMFRNVSCDLAANGIISSGTAIGMGLINAVSHLEKSKAKSKVIILLTDGVNNTGDISPLMAADVAAQMGIRVYTIAVGKQGGRSNQVVAQLPDGESYTASVENTIDTETLKSIAQATGGHYYEAEDNNKLKAIYEDIDKLEKTKLKMKSYEKHYDAYQPFCIAALLLLVLELLSRLIILKRIP